VGDISHFNTCSPLEMASQELTTPGSCSSSFFSVGGLVSDHFGIPSPFKVTLGLLVCSTLFASIFLPYIAPPTPTKRVDGGVEKTEGAFVFLSPLKLLGPNRKAEGGWRGTWGLGLLGMGLFCGVLATGVSPVSILFLLSSFGFDARLPYSPMSFAPRSPSNPISLSPFRPSLPFQFVPLMLQLVGTNPFDFLPPDAGERTLICFHHTNRKRTLTPAHL